MIRIKLFQSTPSARRATINTVRNAKGDIDIFQSTPSARRATISGEYYNTEHH